MASTQREFSQRPTSHCGHPLPCCSREVLPRTCSLVCQLAHAEDRRSHACDSELCTHTLTFRSEPRVYSPRATCLNVVSLCASWSVPPLASPRGVAVAKFVGHTCSSAPLSTRSRAFRPLGALTADIQSESSLPPDEWI